MRMRRIGKQPDKMNGAAATKPLPRKEDPKDQKK
jgi:hypothetical protein